MQMDMDIKIRPLQLEDASISYKWRNDPEVFKYTGNRYHEEITLEKETEWIKGVIEKKDDYRCAILVDGVYVGNIYLTDIQDGQATYHIFIGDKSYWGKGVAKEASRQIISYGFQVLNLSSISLRVRPENVSAVNLYKSLGFKEVDRNETFIKMVI